jgi:hypothetical protein
MKTIFITGVSTGLGIAAAQLFQNKEAFESTFCI